MPEQTHVVRQMIATVGHITQSLGAGRVLGQIFACLYFSGKPKSLDDITKSLGISKGSASMGVRQLEQWNALEKLGVKGDRKDYYRAKDDIGAILTNAVLDLAGKRLKSSAKLIHEAEAVLSEESTRKGSLSPQSRHVKKRVGKLRTFLEKVEGMRDSAVLERFLK